MFLSILAEQGDSFVSGQHGIEASETLQDIAGQIQRSALNSEEWRTKVDALDRFCRENEYNPGTTADLLTSSIFIATILCSSAEEKT